jgi:hypothetical protein
MAAVITLVDGRQNVVRVVSHAVVMRADITDSVSGRRRGEGLERLLGRDIGLRACSLMLRNALGQGLGVFLLNRPCRRSNSCDGAQKSRSKEWLEQHLLDACKRDRDEDELRLILKCDRRQSLYGRHIIERAPIQHDASHEGCLFLRKCPAHGVTWENMGNAYGS